MNSRISLFLAGLLAFPRVLFHQSEWANSVSAVIEVLDFDSCSEPIEVPSKHTILRTGPRTDNSNSTDILVGYLNSWRLFFNMSTKTNKSGSGSFSYYKLTKLQVEGAKERSSRQSEASQVMSRWNAVQSDWKKKTWGAPSSSDDVGLFITVVQETFGKDRELSPFLTERLAKLCRAEYRASKAVEESKFSQSRPALTKTWMKQALTEEEEATIQMIQELQTAIRMERRRVELERYNKIQDLRAGLVAKKEALREAIRQKQEMPSKSFDPPTVSGRRSKTTKEPPSETSTSSRADFASDWIEVDDDFLLPQSQTTTTSSRSNNSDWVLCS